MKICNRGHRHEDEYCKTCHRMKCADRYQQHREEVLAKAKARNEEYKALKAAAEKSKIAATK